MNRAVAVALVLTLSGCGSVDVSDGGPRAAAGPADHCGLPVAERTGGWFCPDSPEGAAQGPAEPPRTVLFDVDYVGIARERENARDGLERCLQQPGTAVTKSDAASPPIRQVSVRGDREAVRQFEQCLLLTVVNTDIERVPERVDSSAAVDPTRTLADRYGRPPTWPGDPWTRNGVEVSRHELSLAAGAEHCNWEDSAYIAGTALPAPRDRRGSLWVRDPKGILEHDPRAKAEFQPRARLPQDAAWTGHVQEGVELWVAPSDNADYVYLVNSADRSDAERWVRGGGGCL